MRPLLVLLLLLLLPGLAQAGLPRATLSRVGVRLPPNAHLDLRLAAPDANGVVRDLAAITAGRPRGLCSVIADPSAGLLPE